MESALVAAPLSVAKAFSPGHITGFVEIPARTSNYLHRGSRGAGFSIDRGITTIVEAFENKKPGYQISINGIVTTDAEVSRWVAEKYLRLADRSYFVKIDHDINIPIGFGLGSSGAAALSLSYALNAALDAGLNREQAAQISHQAEIACKTGLGTVIAEFAGGFEMRTDAGAPGIGTVEKIDLKGYRAVILCQAPISTKSFLTNRIHLINGLGGSMLKRLVGSKSVDDFMEMSYEFANHLGLTEGRCKAPIDILRSHGFGCGIALFGETVFTLVPKERSKEAADLLRVFDGTLLDCKIDNYGARVL